MDRFVKARVLHPLLNIFRDSSAILTSLVVTHVWSICMYSKIPLMFAFYLEIICIYIILMLSVNICALVMSFCRAHLAQAENKTVRRQIINTFENLFFHNFLFCTPPGDICRRPLKSDWNSKKSWNRKLFCLKRIKIDLHELSASWDTCNNSSYYSSIFLFFLLWWQSWWGNIKSQR